MPMYNKGARTIANVDMWLKVDWTCKFAKVESYATQEVVKGLPKFKTNDMQNVCEACQFGKQSRHAFVKERNISERPL